jgi:WD40 repeat protein
VLRTNNAAYSFAFALIVTNLTAQPPLGGGAGGTKLDPFPGGGVIGKFTIPQDPNIIIRQAFTGPASNAPRVWISGGGPEWANGVASTAVPNTRPSEAAVPGGMDAIKMPDGRTLIFTTTMYNHLHAIEVKPGYGGAQEKYCFSGVFTYNAGQLQNRGNLAARAVKVSPDGKTLYVLLGAPAANSGMDEYLYTIPIADCSTKCLDVQQIKEYKLPKTASKGGYFSLAFHPTGRWLVATGYSDEVLVLNTSSFLSQLITLPNYAGKTQSVNSAAVSPGSASFNYQSAPPQLSSAIYVHGGSRALAVIACGVTGPPSPCQYVNTIPLAATTNTQNGPAGGIFHPNQPFYYWNTGATLGSVAVFNTASLFSPMDTGTAVGLNSSLQSGSPLSGAKPSALDSSIDPVKMKLYVNGTRLLPGRSAAVAVFNINLANAAKPMPELPIPYGVAASGSEYLSPDLVVWARPVSGLPICNVPTTCELNTLPVGNICTIAGNGTPGSAPSGSLALNASFIAYAVATGPGRPIYFSEGTKIRSVDKGPSATRKILDFAGTGLGAPISDGPVSTARLSTATALQLVQNKLYFVDGDLNQTSFREIDLTASTANVTRIAGTALNPSGNNVMGSTVTPPSFGTARFNNPRFTPWTGNRLLYRANFDKQVNLLDLNLKVASVLCPNTDAGDSNILLSSNGSWLFVFNNGLKTLNRIPFSGSGCGPAFTIASIPDYVGAIAYEPFSDTLYYSQDKRLVKIQSASSASPQMTVIANASNSFGDVDGPAATAQFKGIMSMTVESTSINSPAYLYIAGAGKLKVLRLR